MNCQQIDKIVYEFCDNQLSPASQSDFQAHLDTCESCRTKVEAYTLDGDLLRTLQIQPVLNADFTDRVMTRIKAGTTAGNRRGRLTSHLKPSRSVAANRWWLGLASAAVVVVALLLSPVFHWGIQNQVAEQTQESLVGEYDQAGAIQTEAAATSTDNSSPPAAAIGKKTNTPVQIAALDRQVKSSVTAATPDTMTGSGPQTYTQPLSTANPARGYELWSLHPANLPQEYSLSSIVSSTDNEITFVYEDKKAGNELTLVIAPESMPLPDVQENSRAGRGASDPPDTSPILFDKAVVKDSAPAPTPAPTSVSASSLSNSYQTVLTGENEPFRVMISGNLSTEELARLAAMIKLEKGMNSIETKP